MFATRPGIRPCTPGFSMKQNMRFSEFAPRLYNLCTTTLKMRHGLIMPSRAFCSDGSQGYPTILLAKHFGTFPFDYGQIGGVFDFGRSPAFVTHGKDLVIVQATHVGFERDSKSYGKYPRHRTACDGEANHTANCGHVAGVIAPYTKGYSSASRNTKIIKDDTGRYLISVRNFFCQPATRWKHQLQLDFPRMMKHTAHRDAEVVGTDPVSRTFIASKEFSRHLDRYNDFKNAVVNKPVSLGHALTSDWFTFNCMDKPSCRYEENIRLVMPWVVTHRHPMLAAAQASVQVEFHRVLDDMYFAKELFVHRNVFYVSGVLVDVAPKEEQLQGADAFFPRTLFVPWAAYVQRQEHEGERDHKEIWDQQRILEELRKQETVNDKAMLLDDEVFKLRNAKELHLPE